MKITLSDGSEGYLSHRLFCFDSLKYETKYLSLIKLIK